MTLRIAIDGPSGAGKSTLARRLASHLDLPYIDTGAMYRAVGLEATRRGCVSAQELTDMVSELDLAVVSDPSDFRVLLAGLDVTGELRSTDVSMRASEVAQVPAVRSWLVERQRAIASDGAVLEGRDIGSEVLPDAELKLFITADESVRIQRRAVQLGDGCEATLAREIRERDRRDSQRKASPLVVPEGAVVIDTGHDNEDGSFARILEALDQALKTR